VIGLMLAAKPGLTPLQIVTGLQQTARPHPAGTYCTTSTGTGTCGAGLVDANGAVTYAQGTTPSTMPTNPPPPTYKWPNDGAATSTPPPTTTPPPSGGGNTGGGDGGGGGAIGLWLSLLVFGLGGLGFGLSRRRG
jgi:serine protease